MHDESPITKEEYIHVLKSLRGDKPLTIEEVKAKQTMLDPGYVKSILDNCIRLTHAVKIGNQYEITHEGSTYLVIHGG